MGRRRDSWDLASPQSPLQDTSQPSTPTTSFLSPQSHSSFSLTRSRPLTPPLRLHLRTLIPSPPLPAEYLATAPPLPYPWIWRCHLCHSVYRLGVTRRCLEDGHLFCSLPSPPPSPVTCYPPSCPSSQSALEPGLATGKDEKEEIEGNETTKQVRVQRRRARRAASRGCRAEFDYGGWSKYNIWRREVRLLKRESTPVTRSKTKTIRGIYRRDVCRKGGFWTWGRDGADRGDGRGYIARDCWRDCDFPSECHHERESEREWEARTRQMRRWEGRWREEDPGSSSSSSSSSSPRRPSHSDFVTGPDAADLDHENGIMLAGDKGGDIDSNLAPGVDGTGDEGGKLGPLGTDTDGLGEAGIQATYTQSVRRKSVEGTIGEVSPPSSPLKECFVSGDARWRQLVWEEKQGGIADADADAVAKVLEVES
ncbi:hypothetical protein JHW43_003666 [Diplocarpon mali]|nr:hypothetical protein JHW43_003666 [Diplocarpon mali]